MKRGRKRMNNDSNNMAENDNLKNETIAIGTKNKPRSKSKSCKSVHCDLCLKEIFGNEVEHWAVDHYVEKINDKFENIDIERIHQIAHKFKCKTCHKIFVNLEYYKEKHVQFCGKDVRPVKCQYCQQLIKPTSFNYHVKYHHADQLPKMKYGYKKNIFETLQSSDPSQIEVYEPKIINKNPIIDTPRIKKKISYAETSDSDPKAHFSDPHEWETNKSLSSENESIDDQASIETDFNSDLVPSQAEDLFSNSPSINRMHKKYAIKDNKIIIIPSRKKYQINKFTKDLEHYYFDVNREDLNNYFTKTAMNEILKKLFDFKPILEINEKFFRKIIDKIHPIHVDSISIDSTLYNINYLKDMIIVNFGMSIASIDWQHTNNSDTTHLAVAVNHDKFFSRYIYTENVVINSTITILKIDQLPQSQHTASILLNFDVIGGNILQIKFCPVFSKTDNNSTFLLISLSNGSIMIYKIDLINSKFTKSTLQYESLLKCTLSLIPDYKKNDKRCCISFDWSISDGGTYVIAGFTDNCLSLWDFKSITDFDSDIFTSIKTINNDKLLGLVELNFIKNNINCLTDTDIIVYNTNLEIVYEYNKFSSDCHSVDIKVFPIDIYFEIVESHRLLKSVFRVIRPDKERKDVITKNFYETESCLAKCSPNMYTNCTALSDYCGNLVLVNIYKDKLPPKSSKYPFPILKMCLKNEQIIISTNNKSKNENFCYKWGYQENQTNIESGIDTLQWNPSLKFYRYLACGSKNGILIIINCKDFL